MSWCVEDLGVSSMKVQDMLAPLLTLLVLSITRVDVKSKCSTWKQTHCSSHKRTPQQQHHVEQQLPLLLLLLLLCRKVRMETMAFDSVVVWKYVQREGPYLLKTSLGCQKKAEEDTELHAIVKARWCSLCVYFLLIAPLFSHKIVVSYAP